MGCKPKSAWRIGTEHEKFGFQLDDLRPPEYKGPRGIGVLLEGLREYGWQGMYEAENLIGLRGNDGSSVTLEPGGQLELSGGLLEDIHQTCCEVHSHLKQVKAVSERLNLGFIGLGFHPKWRQQDMQWMPKGRYQIMRDYMPRVGAHGLDMMTRTCTVQVNLDFSSEADMVRKFRVSLALQPIATALFANSPFTEGEPNGYLSYRSHIWTQTDPNRSGMLPFVFESGMGFERYVDYVLDVPMYFVYRDGHYIDVAGASFRDFMAGKLKQLPGQRATMADWEDHLTTIFPEVRLKQYLEMRGADGGPWHRLCALPAFWTGLLYHQESLDQAYDLIADWTAEERQQLRDNAPKHGLRTPFREHTLRDIAFAVLAIADQGLRARKRLTGQGKDESTYLTPLWTSVETGCTPAERKLRRYHGEWGEKIDPIFSHYAY